MNSYRYGFIIFLSFISVQISAQTFDLSGEIRPRFEYRHGYGTLIPDDQSPAAFVSQRTRLNFGYSHEKLSISISAQNVNVWGDVATTAGASKNGLGMHEAWGQYDFSPAFGVRLGRQVLKYDDERIFGEVGWGQAARSHDALLATFQPTSAHRIDLGLALNADAESKFQETYSVNQYTDMEYLWYHGGFSKFDVSLLALNIGNPYEDGINQKVAYSQTFGTRLDYTDKGWKADASFYGQTGDVGESSLEAFYASGGVSKALSNKFTLGLGIEFLSGTDQNTTDRTLRSFTPWFGTNHKFNGWMDYFYVGNHTNSVGLTDVFAQLQYKLDKWTFKLYPHYFSAPAVVISNEPGGEAMDSYLGTELDFALAYKIAEYVKVQAGYSQIFATETMEQLKGGNADNTNHWAWVMLTFNPKLFHWESEVKK